MPDATSVTNRRVRDLIERGEQIHVEFKSEAKQALPDHDLVDAVVCLANLPAGYDRGYLLIGVEDDGTVTGARPRHGTQTDAGRLEAMIFARTEPAVATTVSVADVLGGKVVAIEIPRQPNICASKHGKVVRRVVGINRPACVPFYPYEYQSYRSDLGLIDVSAQALPAATRADFDPLEIERLRQTIARLGGDRHLTHLDDDDLLKALNLVESQDGCLIPTVAGLLLVGRQGVLNRMLPNHDVRFQVFGPASEVIVNDSLMGPLLRTLEDIERRFSARIIEQEILVGLVRLPIPDYAPEALREAVNNAVLHRDYSRHNAVYIQWHPERLLITSPGGFVRGVTLENLLVHEPVPRNPRLADAFLRVGLIERTGRGIDKIFLGQVRYGRPLPDYTQSDADGVRVSLSGERASLEFARLVFEQQANDRVLTLDQLLILDQLRRERRTNAMRAAQVIQKSEPIARATLERLVERGLAEARGERRGRVYMLSAAVYRQLGEPAGYIRTRGFDRIQQEAMILQFVKAHGQIRRVDAIELCSLTPREATRLLGRMVDKGLLQRRGTDRGSHYTAGPSV